MATAAAQIRRTAAEDRKLVTELLRLLEDDDGPLLQKIEKFTLSVCDAFDQTAPPPPRSSSVDPTTSYPLACKEIHAEYQILVEAPLWLLFSSMEDVDQGGSCSMSYSLWPIKLSLLGFCLGFSP